MPDAAASRKRQILRLPSAQRNDARASGAGPPSSLIERSCLRHDGTTFDSSRGGSTSPRREIDDVSCARKIRVTAGSRAGATSSG
jgi:hypothetical protein